MGTRRAVSSLLVSLPQAEIVRIAESLESEVKIRHSALETHLPLTWDMIGEMHRAGITIGSHTRNHAVLINETFEKILDETQGSREELERRLGTPIRHIAYPDGQFNTDVLEAAAMNYRFGYTTCRHRDPLYPLLTIPRLQLWENACLDSRGGFSPAILKCLARGRWPMSCHRDHRVRRRFREASGI